MRLSDGLFAAALAGGALALRGASAQPPPPSLPPSTMPTLLVTPEWLQQNGAAPDKARTYAPHFTYWAARFGIDTPLRLAHFLAAVMHETGSLAHARELPSRYASSRLTHSGRGALQLTNSGNYRAYTDYLRRQNEVPYVNAHGRPSVVESLPYYVHSGTWYWDYADCNSRADRGTGDDAILAVHTRVNCWSRCPGGYPVHWDDRLRRSRLALSLRDGLEPIRQDEAEDVRSIVLGFDPGAPGSPWNPPEILSPDLAGVLSDVLGGVFGRDRNPYGSPYGGYVPPPNATASAIKTLGVVGVGIGAALLATRA